MTRVQFFVPGVPAPQGSKRGFVVGGRAVLVEDSKRSRPWRSEVAAAGILAKPRGHSIDGPFGVSLLFGFSRPKSHLTSKGELRKGVPEYPGRPDLDKLVRTVLDGLTGIYWRDDAQVQVIASAKEYAEDGAESAVGLMVMITRLETRGDLG
jgi:crossover junction endodeoxyribonuclease RusA